MAFLLVAAGVWGTFAGTVYVTKKVSNRRRKRRERKYHEALGQQFANPAFGTDIENRQSNALENSGEGLEEQVPQRNSGALEILGFDLVLPGSEDDMTDADEADHEDHVSDWSRLDQIDTIDGLEPEVMMVQDLTGDRWIQPTETSTH